MIHIQAPFPFRDIGPLKHYKKKIVEFSNCAEADAAAHNRPSYLAVSISDWEGGGLKCADPILHSFISVASADSGIPN